jgi:hypothetical protein
MHACAKCSKMCGWLFLIIGILYLLSDLGAISWWNFSWYTAVFVLMGLGWIGKSSCKDCQSMMKKK